MDGICLSQITMKCIHQEYLHVRHLVTYSYTDCLLGVLVTNIEMKSTLMSRFGGNFHGLVSAVWAGP